MKRITSILLLALASLSCSKEKIDPPHIRVSINEPFLLSAPSEVTLNENSLSFKLEEFSDFGIGMGLTGYSEVQTKIIFNEKIFNLLHQNICDWPYLNCTPYYYPEAAGKPEYTYGGIGYCEYMPLNENLKLTFRRVTKSTVVKEYDSKAKILRVDSAEFIIEPM